MEFKIKQVEDAGQVVLRFTDSAMLDAARLQVLSNFDLLQSICSFLVTNHEEVVSNYRIPAPTSQHLLWISLTCKIFFEPAMDVLWEYFSSWTALLKLIPILTLQQQWSQNTYTTREIILESHLERLNFYARRIKHLRLSGFGEQVSSHVYAGISQFQKRLFPALTALSIPKFQELQRDNLNALSLVSSPIISEVVIGSVIPETEVFAASLLRNLSTKSRFLQHIRLSGRLSDVILGLLKTFQCPSTFELDIQHTSLEKETMNDIWNIETLDRVCLKLDQNSSADCQTMSKATSMAPRVLELAGPTGQVFTILQNLNLAQVQVANLSFLGLGPDGTASLAQEAIQSFVQPDIPSSLRAMTVDVANGIQIPWKSFMPLNVCQHLTYLIVTIDYLSSERLVRLCAKGEWKALTTLRLTCNRVKPGDAGLSLHDLRIFAEHCPRLVELDISLESLAKTSNDVEILREVITKPRQWSGRSAMKELEILPLKSRPDDITSEAGQKRTRDAVAVARYIHWLFPCLEAVFFPANNDWFDGVEDMVKGFKSIRTENETALAGQTP